jgi:transposase
MSFLLHYKFKQRLMAKAADRGVRVLIVSEHYTSKTCGRCGEVNEDLGAARTFECESCFAYIDRDCNGALKYFTTCDSEKLIRSSGRLQDGAMAHMLCLA